MWTADNRARYDRSRLRYPSDLTDEEWALIAPQEAVVQAWPTRWRNKSFQRPIVHSRARL